MTFKWFISDILQYEAVEDDNLDDLSSGLQLSAVTKVELNNIYTNRYIQYY